MNRRWLLVTLITASSLNAQAGLVKAGGVKAPKLKKLIFLDFSNETNDPAYKWAQANIPDNIHKSSSAKYQYVKIEREVWEPWLKKKKININNISPDTVHQLGKDLGANGVIYGKFRANKEAGTLRIEGKILSVVDNEIVAETFRETPVDTTMFDKVNEVSLELARNIDNLFLPSNKGALMRSAVLPGWGQFYKQRRPWGYAYSVGMGVAAASTIFFGVQFLLTADQYSNPGDGDNTLDLRNKANTYGKISLISFFVMIGIYGVNLLDAYFLQGDYGKVLSGEEEISLRPPVQWNMIAMKKEEGHAQVGMEVHCAF